MSSIYPIEFVNEQPECEHCDAPYDVDETGYCYLCRPGFVKDREVDLATIRRANRTIKDAIERIEYTLKYTNHNLTKPEMPFTLSEANDLNRFTSEYFKHNKI